MEPRRSLWRLATEFAVIVAGVSVGLFADDWRQGQEVRAEEQRFLEDLEVDLMADSVNLARVREWYVGWDTGALALRGWLDQPAIPGDTLRALTSLVGGFRSYEPTRAAYERMKASGRMNFLGDRELQAAVGAYFESRQPYLESVVDNVASVLGLGWVGTMVEWFMPDGVEVAGTHWVTDPETGALLWGAPDSWDAFRSDPEMRRSLDQVGFFGANVALRFTEGIEENRALLALLRSTMEEES